MILWRRWIRTKLNVYSFLNQVMRDRWKILSIKAQTKMVLYSQPLRRKLPSLLHKRVQSKILKNKRAGFGCKDCNKNGINSALFGRNQDSYKRMIDGTSYWLQNKKVVLNDVGIRICDYVILDDMFLNDNKESTIKMFQSLCLGLNGTQKGNINNRVYQDKKDRKDQFDQVEEFTEKYSNTGRFIKWFDIVNSAWDSLACVMLHLF